MTTIGFVGLGNMGAPMARNLARQNFRVLAFDARSEATDAVNDQPGIEVGRTLASVAADADLLITMLPDNEHVRSVLAGENGAAEHLRAGAVAIDMSTISPVVARELHTDLAARGIGLVDAPVSGGTIGAEKGTLTIMAGGEDTHVAAARPALEAMGTTVVHAGGPGMGQIFKLCNQVIVVGNLVAISEALALCRAGGGDPAALLEAIGAGAAGSWMLENLAPKMVSGDDAFGFPIDLQLKDLRLIGEAAHGLNASLPTTALITALYLSARAHGAGGHGNQAIHRVLERLSAQDPEA